MLTIAEVWVFVEPGEAGETVLGVVRRGTWTPLVATDRPRAAELAVVASQSGRAYRALRFAQREDITENLPRRSHKNGSVSAVSAIVAADDDGDEAIVTSPDHHQPLVAVFPRSLRAMIRVAESTGQAFRVLRFKGREDLTAELTAGRGDQ